MKCDFKKYQCHIYICMYNLSKNNKQLVINYGLPFRRLVFGTAFQKHF